MSPSVDEVSEKLFLKKSVIQPDIKVKGYQLKSTFG